MLASRRYLLWAVGFGLLSALLVGLFLQGLDGRTEERYPVVVAARAIESGTLLTPAMLEVRQWPRSAALPGVAGSVEGVAGKRTLVAFVAGQPVLSHQIADRDGVLGVNQRLITIPIDELASFGYRLHPGSRVDVIGVQREADSVHAEMVLEGILVFAVGTEGPSARVAEPRSATLVVTSEEGLRLARWLAGEGTIRLMLRGG